MVSSARYVVWILFTLLVNDLKVGADKGGSLKTKYFGPPPEPGPGEHWMQAAVRELRKQRCPGQCSKPLGMEDRRIPDESIKASSMWGGREDHGPKNARLNNEVNVDGWVADGSDKDHWIQVELLTTATVTGLITQGRGDDNYRVTTYQVAGSDDGQSWDYMKYPNGTTVVFPGNTDRNSHVTVRFPTALYTMFVRIRPIEWVADPSIRFEVLGCY